jgi:hypothetical protein
MEIKISQMRCDTAHTTTKYSKCKYTKPVCKENPPSGSGTGSEYDKLSTSEQHFTGNTNGFGTGINIHGWNMLSIP